MATRIDCLILEGVSINGSDGTATTHVRLSLRRNIAAQIVRLPGVQHFAIPSFESNGMHFQMRYEASPGYRMIE